MERIAVITVGAVIAVTVLVYIIKLLVLQFTGIKEDAEVVAVREIKQGTYVHTLRFSFNGMIVQEDDKTGYSQPFSKGDVLQIVCSKKSPDNFEYAAALRKNIIVAGVLLLMSLLIIVRFAFLVTD